MLEAGTEVVDEGSMVWPPHPAVTQLKVRSGPNHGAKCRVDGPLTSWFPKKGMNNELAN